MAKVLIRAFEQAKPSAMPAGYAGSARLKQYFDAKENPLQLHVFELQGSDTLTLHEIDTDRAAYVWKGVVEAQGHRLREGSSLVVEHGGALALSCLADDCAVVLFAASGPARQRRAGGRVHLLPTECVPRCGDLGSGNGVGGGMHADSACSTCEVWLHENTFTGVAEALPVGAEAGVHCHTEDEIIFVTAGQIRLGSRLHAAGTALAISANTFYGFTAGPEGLRFVNFRASPPESIVFRDRAPMDERGYWSSRLPRPVYIDL
jgi:hypothetical protein